jgi:hypothetical protein
MTREDFIQLLEDEKCSYEIQGDNIVVTHRGNIDLGTSSLPPNVKFRNSGYTNLPDLISLPPGTEFENGSRVFLDSLKSIPSYIQFNNGTGVYLEFIMGGWNNVWEGNIKGIDCIDLLNKMISLGLLDKKR